MQVVVARGGKGILILRNYSVIFSSAHLAQFHSTSVCNDKRRKKPSSSQIKFSTRQKRNDAKKALNDLLFHFGASTGPFQPANLTRKKERIECWDADSEDDYDNSTDKNWSKSSSRRAHKAEKNRMRRRLRRAKFDDEDDYRETIFHARFGNQGFTWSFNPSFQSSTMGFDWRWDSTQRNSSPGEWEVDSESESDDKTSCVGCHSDRRILGLPPNGPLKMEDVKTAFRLSALKWHPDKHQGPSQAAAEEKFKECVDAYKCLCDMLTAT